MRSCIRCVATKKTGTRNRRAAVPKSKPPTVVTPTEMFPLAVWFVVGNKAGLIRHPAIAKSAEKGGTPGAARGRTGAIAEKMD